MSSPSGKATYYRDFMGKWVRFKRIFSANELPCPVCGAPAGQKCDRSEFTTEWYPMHSERYRDADIVGDAYHALTEE
jgi:hypothetical protein